VTIDGYRTSVLVISLKGFSDAPAPGLACVYIILI